MERKQIDACDGTTRGDEAVTNPNQRPRHPETDLLAACWRESPDHLLLIDADQCVHWHNRDGNNSTEPRPGRLPPIDALLGGDLLSTTRRAIAEIRETDAQPPHRTHECYERKPNGHERWLVVRARRLNDAENMMLVCISDVSPQKLAARDEDRRHAEARHRQKLETLGTLATGVAHEINNPVQAIVSCTELLLAELGERTEARDLARDVLGEAHRIAKVVRTLMDFARPQPEELRAEDPALIIERALVWTRMLLRRDIINLRVQVDPGLPPVRCRPRQIQTVLLHLITNAREALHTRSRTTDEPTVTIGARLGDTNDTVCLIVQDDGPGIPTAVIERIFDPFYTTKPDNQGTGLGLYLAREIVTSLAGTITVRSAPGVATRFSVELPIDGSSAPKTGG